MQTYMIARNATELRDLELTDKVAPMEVASPQQCHDMTKE